MQTEKSMQTEKRMDFHLLISWAASEAKKGLVQQNAKESAVVRLADTLLERAVEFRASDLHLEPQEDSFKIRYRVDGLLQQETEKIPLPLAEVLISRLKVMAGMDIAQHQRPQDGHMDFERPGKHIDIRVSALPTIYGELLVLRFMNVEEGLLDIAELGFSESNEHKFRELIHKPSGLIIVSAPVNNGKTTSLYAAVQELNRPERNIITLEDPVERRLPGINQVQINIKAGMTYVAGLKAALRQDVQTVLLGEIRDGDTAEMAVRIALTGHLLLTTLHTENAVAVIFRLREMGIPPYLIAATLSGVVSQRLVRRSCPLCRQEYEVEEPSAAALMLGENWHPGLKLKKSPGCEACRGTGYLGRVALQEVMPVTPALREAILQEADRQSVQRLAEQEGMQTLWQDGIAKVLAGVTTLSELKRVL